MDREYLRTRRDFAPSKGSTYNNLGGGCYRCVGTGGFLGRYDAQMQNTTSGWTFTARGIGIYEDGKIDWDYSTNGYFGRS